MSTIVTISLSATTFIFATVFLGVVARHNAAAAWLHSNGLNPTPSFWGTWVSIMIMVCFTFLISISSLAIHTAKFFQRLPFTFINTRLALIDIATAVCAFVGWLTFAIYYYGILENHQVLNLNNVLQYEENTINSVLGGGGVSLPPDSAAVDGSEVAFGVLTMISAAITAFITFQVPERVMFATQTPAPTPVMNPATTDTVDTKEFNIEIEV